MSLWEKVFGKRDEHIAIRVTSPKAERTGYDPDPHKAYRIIGGKETDLLEKCPSCAAYYQGKLESACHFCGNARMVYLLEAEGDLPEGIINPDNLIPVFSNSHSEIGNEAVTVTAIAGTVIIGEEAEVDYVGGNNIEIGGWFSGQYLIGDQVVMGEKCDLQGILAHDLLTGNELEIRHLLVVPPKGSARFGDECSIYNLIVGEDATVIFGDDCHVDNLYRQGSTNITAGANFTCDSDDTEKINELLGDAQEIINEVLQ